MKKRVALKYHAPNAGRVFLAGSFNGWNGSVNPLKKNSKGEWSITLHLYPGTYEYLFVVDGEWKRDPACKNYHLNRYGGHNCVLIVE
jgi:1,4-alpha-glucan branching enzyme